MNKLLSLNSVTSGYGHHEVLKDITFDVYSGEVISILGPNGVGKTTLFLTILGLLQAISGEIIVDGKDIRILSPKQKARLIGYVPQIHKPSFPFNVFEIIQMGRTPYINPFFLPNQTDTKTILEIMDVLGLLPLRERKYTQISGGERQLVLIARALAQQPKILMMDEPTSNLDFGNQTLVLNLIKGMARKGISIIMTTHSPNQALLCATKVILINPDSSYLVGDCKEVINEKNLRQTYGVPVKIISYEEHPNKFQQSCIPILE